MAKVAFSKLKCKINNAEVPVKIGEETVLVKQYLPIQDKLALIGRVISVAYEEDYTFSNPIKRKMLQDFEVFVTYTNLSFTDKQLEDFIKIYDTIASTGILDQVLQAIPEKEYFIIDNGVNDIVEAIYAYQHSFLGILDTLKTDYNETELDVNKLTNQLKQPEFANLIKDIVPLLGLNDLSTTE